MIAHEELSAGFLAMRGALVDPVFDGPRTNSAKADLSDGIGLAMARSLGERKEEGCSVSGWRGRGKSPECARLFHCDNWTDRKGQNRAIMTQEDGSW